MCREGNVEPMLRLEPIQKYNARHGKTNTSQDRN